jgi:hypothetical protein
MGYRISLADFTALQRKMGPEAAARMAAKEGWDIIQPEPDFTPMSATGGLGGGTKVEDDYADIIPEDTADDVADDTADVAAAYPVAGGGLGAANYQAAQRRVDKQIASQMRALEEGQKRLRERRVGPSDAEKWFSIAAALGKPTRTGSFGESLGNLNEVLAQQNALKRKAQEERDMLLEQYGLKIGNERLRMLQSGLTQAGQVYRAEMAAQAKAEAAKAPKYRLTSTDEWTIEPGTGGMPPMNSKGQFVVSTLEQANNVPRGKEFVYADDPTGKVRYGQ